MSRFVWPAVLAAALGPARPAVASPGPPPGPFVRLLQSELVVVGKVEAVEKDPAAVELKSADGATWTVKYPVAVIHVRETLPAAGKPTRVRVVFDHPDPKAPDARENEYGLGPLTLKPGEEGCFFLRKLSTDGLYEIPIRCLPIDRAEPGFDVQVGRLRRWSAVIADPVKFLKADNPEDRYTAAAVLLRRYRSYPGGDFAEVPIPADESRLIVQALAKQDWLRYDPDLPTPDWLEEYLGMTARDGYQPGNPYEPQDRYVRERSAYFRRWAAGDGLKFVLKRIVPKK